MSSYATIIIFIALFTIVPPTRTIHAESRKHSIRGTSQSIKQENGGPRVEQHQQQPADYSYQYRPFGSAPEHIKQLVYQAYSPQEPYVNPHAFFYNINSPTPYEASSSEKFSITQRTLDDVKPSQSPVGYRKSFNQQSPAHTIARIAKTPSQNGIKYKTDVNSPHYRFDNRADHVPQQEQSKRSSESVSPTRNFPNREHLQHVNHQMPRAIEQLLQYQAQIPYNVLANHIFFQAEKPFVPKPLPQNIIERSGNYPNQVYYLKTNGEILSDNNEFTSVLSDRQE